MRPPHQHSIPIRHRHALPRPLRPPRRRHRRGGSSGTCAMLAGEPVQLRRTSTDGGRPARPPRWRSAAPARTCAMVFCGLSLDGIDGAEVLRRIRERTVAARHPQDPARRLAGDGDAVDDLLQRGALHARLDPDFDARTPAQAAAHPAHRLRHPHRAAPDRRPPPPARPARALDRLQHRQGQPRAPVLADERGPDAR